MSQRYCQKTVCLSDCVGVDFPSFLYKVAPLLNMSLQLLKLVPETATASLSFLTGRQRLDQATTTRDGTCSDSAKIKFFFAAAKHLVKNGVNLS